MNIWPQPESWSVPDDALTGLSAEGTLLERWQESLDVLASEAEAVLGLSDGAPATPFPGVQSWGPPTDLGPMPEVLFDRARSVLRLQDRAVTILANSRNGVERELAEAARPSRDVQPVYVDVTG